MTTQNMSERLRRIARMASDHLVVVEEMQRCGAVSVSTTDARDVVLAETHLRCIIEANTHEPMRTQTDGPRATPQELGRA